MRRHILRQGQMSQPLFETPDRVCHTHRAVLLLDTPRTQFLARNKLVTLHCVPALLLLCPHCVTLCDGLCDICVICTHSPDEELMPALLQHISSNIALFEGQSLVNTIWALARLQDMRRTTHKASSAAGAPVFPLVPHQLVQSLLGRCDPQMLHWEGRDIAQAAWGLGKLGARPSAAWKQVGWLVGWCWACA